MANEDKKSKNRVLILLALTAFTAVGWTIVNSGEEFLGGILYLALILISFGYYIAEDKIKPI